MRLKSSAGKSNRCPYAHKLSILLPTCSQEDKRQKHPHITKEEKQRNCRLVRDSVILLGRIKNSNLTEKTPPTTCQ